jgi:hypothetical protein
MWRAATAIAPDTGNNERTQTAFATQSQTSHFEAAFMQHI